jgi:hypothetical protein
VKQYGRKLRNSGCIRTACVPLAAARSPVAGEGLGLATGVLRITGAFSRDGCRISISDTLLSRCLAKRFLPSSFKIWHDWACMPQEGILNVTAVAQSEQ